MSVTSLLVGLSIVLQDPAPQENDIVAGWGAFWIFVGGCIAVALLGWSLIRHLRKAEAAKDAGVYGDPPVRAGSPEDVDRAG